MKGEKQNNILFILLGACIGFVNGFFGGGGGMICVPLLTHFLKLPQKKAHATAILVILPITLFSALVYLFSGKFPVGEGLLVGLGVSVGGILGAVLLKKLSAKSVAGVFALLMIVAGLKMIF